MLNAVDVRGCTPLHMVSGSSFRSAIDVIKLLLEIGVEINVVGKKENSPLHYAGKKGKREIFKVRVDKGANSRLKNHSS